MHPQRVHLFILHSLNSLLSRLLKNFMVSIIYHISIFVNICKKERPDAVVASGSIFETVCDTVSMGGFLFIRVVVLPDQPQEESCTKQKQYRYYCQDSHHSIAARRPGPDDWSSVSRDGGEPWCD